MLAASAVLLAAGLLLLGSSQTIVWYLLAWLLLGVGMGSGLTDAAFSTLGSLYGEDARGAITSLTLFAGFSSTICWPLSAFLLDHLGWRQACFIYAAIQIAIALPILLVALPRGSPMLRPTPEDAGARSGGSLDLGELPLFSVLAAVLTLSAAVLSMVGVHLLPLLQARGLELSAAVGLGAIVGPSQVGARLAEMLLGRHYHPIWTMIISAVLVAAGTALLFEGYQTYSAAIVLYGAGNGLGSIARGTLALALRWTAPVFGPDAAPCAPYFTINGALSIPRGDCFSSRRRKLGSRPYLRPLQLQMCCSFGGALDACTKALTGCIALLRQLFIILTLLTGSCVSVRAFCGCAGRRPTMNPILARGAQIWVAWAPTCGEGSVASR